METTISSPGALAIIIQALTLFVYVGILVGIIYFIRSIKSKKRLDKLGKEK